VELAPAAAPPARRGCWMAWLAAVDARRHCSAQFGERRWARSRRRAPAA